MWIRPWYFYGSNDMIWVPMYTFWTSNDTVLAYRDTTLGTRYGLSFFCGYGLASKGAVLHLRI